MGCDGSSGHSNYSQRYSTGEEGQPDTSLLAACPVPLRLHTTNGTRIIWNNPRPSSTRFCQPIKLVFEKETTELAKKEIENIERQIADLQPTFMKVNEKKVIVTHCMKMTMIDGKTFGVVTETGVQVCGVCKATPKVMNDLEAVAKLVPDISKFEYGLSTLHAYIRVFECILHIAYRQKIKKWRVSKPAEKLIVKQTKMEIVKKIKEQMFLSVDIPKPGHGTTNDGNTASLFFEQYSLASSVTGIDEEL
ncbi:hypothetical protein EVAR_87555_1 [Eumeta japonica]|uniref:V(D)J recombination-activating protein 1 RNase H domain-containing protein n=1 Tax=Eumeta variegata TaxID=151549 RepID=A0A4C1XTR5_EUMVA|nr:hypothetical protein EVAR_87555_1 [Eumeta japonica]